MISYLTNEECDWASALLDELRLRHTGTADQDHSELVCASSLSTPEFEHHFGVYRWMFTSNRDPTENEQAAG